MNFRLLSHTMGYILWVEAGFLLLPALTACASPDADIVPMVKPQFEVGKDRVGAGGVVSLSFG